MRKYPLFALLLALLLLLLLTVAVPAFAQDSNVVVAGLNNPRGLYYDADGVLWITEAGTGGDLSANSDLGPVKFGGTASVLKLEVGNAQAELVLGGLPSAQGFDDVIGVNSVYRNADGLWIATGLGPLADPLVESVIQIDPASLRIKQILDLYAFEAANNPDEDFIATNPADIAVDASGTYYLLDASGNDLLTWTPADGLKLFHAWTDLPVPTSVDIDADGNLYVGFLSAFPFEAGSARIEKWSPSGELLDTYSGLTGVTDVLVAPDGTLYAVQIADGYGDLGWNANSGSVVSVSDAGVTPVAQGLNYPYRMAWSPEGGLVVTVNSAFSAAGSGQVIVVTGNVTANGQVEPPATTPEPPAATPEVAAPAVTPEVPAATPETAG